MTLLSPSWAQRSSDTAAPAPAKENAAQEEVITLESFTVTGSHIRRIEEERVLPVTLYDRDDIDVRAASTPIELLEYLPMVGETPINEEATAGGSARGDVASISLRSIGSANTLVLVNGRRMPPHPIFGSESGVPALSVNVNTLPGAAVQRVEILRDGASAVYGADAAAGVVNFILDEDADGTRLRLRGSITEHGGGGERRVTISDGRILNLGRTNLRVTLDFLQRDVLMSSERWFSADADMRGLMGNRPPWNGVPYETPFGNITDNDFNNRSTVSNYGHFVRGSFQTIDGEVQFVGSRPTGNRGITTSTTPGSILTARGTTTPGEFYLVPLADGGTGLRQTGPSTSVLSHEGEWRYNINQDRHLLPSSDRWSFVTTFGHELNDRTKLFGDFVYYHADTTAYREPSGFDATSDENIFVPASNPWNPFGERYYHPTGAPNADGTLRVVGTPADVLLSPGDGVRPRDFKRKVIDVNSQSLRGVVGLRGKVFDQWGWETAVMYGRARTEENEHFTVRESRLREALARTDATAFNPFGYTFRAIPNPGTFPSTSTVANNPVLIQIDQPYSNPASVVDPLYDDYIKRGFSSLATWDFKADGPLFTRWGRTVSAAFGTELRYETYKSENPPYSGLNPEGSWLSNPYLRENDNDFILASPNIDLNSDRNVIAGFAELLIPVFAPRHRVPLVRGLEFTAAARYERFSDFGDTFKPKFGMSWRVADWLGVRTSYNESFRAPNLVQTDTTPLQRNVSGITDYYRYDVTGVNVDASRTRRVFRMGNDALQPEEAKTITAGVIVQVPGVKGLSFTVDYWQLEQTNVIANLSASEQLRRDRDQLATWTAEQVAAGQNPNTLSANSGGANYVGNPKVIRMAVTPADQAVFTTWNANNPSAPRVAVGQLISVVDDYLNLAGRETEGFDLTMQYRMPRTRFGTFTLRAEGTWTTKFEEQLDETSIIEDNLNENGVTRWKATGSISWRHGKWRAGWFTQYVKGTVDTSAALGAAGTNPDIINAALEQLGYPRWLAPFSDTTGVMRYGLRLDDWIMHNTHVEYRFGRQKDIHNNVIIRLGVNNVFDKAPGLADESRGYRGALGNPRGRQYYMQLSKTF